jgi:hypothetical protein
LGTAPGNQTWLKKARKKFAPANRKTDYGPGPPAPKQMLIFSLNQGTLPSVHAVSFRVFTPTDRPLGSHHGSEAKFMDSELLA